MAQGMTTKTLKDGSGATFTGQFYDDGSGNLYPVSTAANMLSNPGKQTFTRPADTTPYAAGDLIANSTTAGSVAPLSFTGATMGGLGGNGVIDGAVLGKSTSAAATIRTHWFKTSPAVTNGDNGAILATSLDLDNYIGFIDVSCVDGVAGGALGVTFNAGLQYTLSGADTLYCLLEALTVFTPGNAEVFTLRPKFKRFA